MADLLHGPLNKSLYTQTLELVTKILLYSKGEMDFYYKKTGSVWNLQGTNELHVVIGDIDVNLTLLFSKANFSHIHMDQSDSEKFTNKTGIIYNTFLPQIYNYVAQHGGLTEAEKRAVNYYTGSGYLAINDMLYKKSLTFSNNTTLRENVLKAVMLGSGLNRILPSPEDHKVKTYRGEKHTPQHEIQERIKLVNQGGGFTEQPAFMSTSSSINVSKGFILGHGTGKCMIHFDSIYGVSVEKASASNFEHEYLILPGQIYWKKYEFIDGVHTFHAEAVRPLIPAKEEVCAQDIVNFNKLLELAKNKGIPVNFLTPYLQNVVSNPQNSVDGTSSLTPVMKTASKSAKQKLTYGLKTALQLGIGGYLFAVGLTLIAPPIAITSTSAFLGIACLGGYILLNSAITLIPEIIGYIKKKPTVQTPPLQPASYQPTAVQPPKPVAATVTELATAKEYKEHLKKEENAVKDLEDILINKFPQAPQFIAKLHDILGLENANGDKLLLMQYAHLLENRVNEADAVEFPVVEKEVLEEAATAIKEKTLLI